MSPLSRQAPPGSPSPSKDPDVEHLPFFMMDWLEEMVQDQDIETLAQLLQTPDQAKHLHLHTHPRRHLPYDECPPTPKSSNTKRKQHSRRNHRSESPTDRALRPVDLFPSRREQRGEAQHQQRSLSTNATPENAKPYSIYKKSLAMGNGWNAKGLNKAQQGLWQDALACWDHALEIRLPLLGKNHLEVANTYNNRGIALGKLGHYEAALEALQTALQIRIPLLGKAHPQVLSTFHNVANVHQQAGQLDQALQVFGHAKELGLNSGTSQSCMTQVARLCVAIGHTYYQAEQWEDARDAYNDAMDIYSCSTSGEQQQELTDLQRDIYELNLIIQQQGHRHHKNPATSQQALLVGE